VFTVDRDRWVLKGATAMLARLEDFARHSNDVDLYHEGDDLREAEQALRNAALVDLGDYFRFTLEPGRPVVEGGKALRIPAKVFLGVTEFTSFHVDLVTDIGMTAQPDDVGPLVPVPQLGLPQTTYRVYPVPDHIADKICALLETHPRRDGALQSSTRYRDLVDLVVFAHTCRVDATEALDALRSESLRRPLRLPQAFPKPADPGWPAGYARAARDARGLAETDLNAATETVRRFVNPMLDRSAAGVWSPKSLAWEK
jgi:hypothetical protein